MQPYPPDSECQTRLSWDDSGAESYEIHRLVWWDANSWFYKTDETAGTSCSGGTCHFDESGDHKENATLADTPCPLQINAGANFLANSCDPELWQAFYVIAKDHTASGTPIRSAPSEILWFNCPDAAASAMLWPQQSESEPLTLYARAEVCEPANVEESFALLAADVATDAGDRAVPRATEPALAAEWLSPPATLGQSSSNPPYRVFNVHVDHLGSTRRLTNPWGTVVEEHDFLPFGEEIAPVYSRGGKMFTGHERDDETGLDYMQQRYYSNLAGRFFSSDPLPGILRQPLSWNQYTYAANSPLRFVDPDGRRIGSSARERAKQVTNSGSTTGAEVVEWAESQPNVTFELEESDKAGIRETDKETGATTYHEVAPKDVGATIAAIGERGNSGEVLAARISPELTDGHVTATITVYHGSKQHHGDVEGLSRSGLARTSLVHELREFKALTMETTVDLNNPGKIRRLNRDEAHDRGREAGMAYRREVERAGRNP